LSTTATRTNVVVFYSPHRNLRLVRVPESSETLLVVQEAILNRDLDRLGELLEEERNGHSREDVIEACQRAIAALEAD
jgi:hypothetical protein